MLDEWQGVYGLFARHRPVFGVVLNGSGRVDEKWLMSRREVAWRRAMVSLRCRRSLLAPQKLTNSFDAVLHVMQGFRDSVAAEPVSRSVGGENRDQAPSAVTNRPRYGEEFFFEFVVDDRVALSRTSASSTISAARLVIVFGVNRSSSSGTTVRSFSRGCSARMILPVELACMG